MATWGVQQYGVRYMQSESDPIVKGYVYEEIRKYDSDIPPDKYFQLLTQLREKIDGSEYGLKTQYIEVNEKWVRVQFTKTGSPLITWATVIQIIVVAISVALVGWAASLLTHELYKLATVLGPENVSMIVNVLVLFFFISFLSPIMDMVTRAFRRKE